MNKHNQGCLVHPKTYTFTLNDLESKIYSKKLLEKLVSIELSGWGFSKLVMSNDVDSVVSNENEEEPG